MGKGLSNLPFEMPRRLMVNSDVAVSLLPGIMQTFFTATWRDGVAFLIVIYFGVFPATAGCGSKNVSAMNRHCH